MSHSSVAAGVLDEPTIRPCGDSNMSYVPALDGVRAVAILGVLVFHALPRNLQGGFTGVDVFYVLSGFLIASVILYDLRGQSFSIREFYLRRVQRLLPNAILTILFTVAVSQLVSLPSQATKVAQHGLWTIFNLSNVYVWRNVGGYWGDSASVLPLLHTWSLAVEEQFYLLFPAILVFLSRRAHLFRSIALLTLVSLALCIYGTRTHPAAAFYFLPTRAWEPLLGAALATWMVPVKRTDPLRHFGSSRLVEIIGWAGLALIVGGFFLVTEQRFPGVVALVPTTGTLLVLVSVADGRTRLAALLSLRPLVFIGQLSYSLYLWHWPLMAFGRQYAYLTDSSPEMWMLAGEGAGVGLSLVAFWLVEQPLRRRGEGRRRRLYVLAATVSFGMVACSILAARRSAMDPHHRFHQPSFSGPLYSLARPQSAASMSSTKYEDVLFPAPRPIPPELWESGGIVHQWGSDSPQIVVLGSSHALMFGRLIDDICRRLEISVAFLCIEGAPVFFPTAVSETLSSVAKAQSFDEARKGWIRKWKPDAVLVIDRWDTLSGEPAKFNQKLKELVGELAPHTQRLILFSQVPVMRLGNTLNLREYVTWHVRTTGRLPRIRPDEKEAFRQASLTVIGNLAQAFPNLRLLRVDQPFHDNGSVRFAVGRDFLYADDDHLTDAGSELVREVCMKAIAAAVADKHISMVKRGVPAATRSELLPWPAP